MALGAFATSSITSDFAKNAKNLNTKNINSIYTLYNNNEQNKDFEWFDKLLKEELKKAKLPNMSNNEIIKLINKHTKEVNYISDQILNVNLSKLALLKEGLKIYRIYARIDPKNKGIELKVVYFIGTSDSHVYEYFIEHIYKKYLTTKEKTLIILGSIFGVLIIGITIFLFFKYKNNPKNKKIKQKIKEWKKKNRKKNDWN